MTRKQYIRNLRMLCIAIHKWPTINGLRLGKSLRDVKMICESHKYARRCYQKMWDDLKMARDCFGVP